MLAVILIGCVKYYSKEVIGIVDFNNMDRTGNKIYPIKKSLRNDEYSTISKILHNTLVVETADFYDEHDTVSKYLAYNIAVKQGYTIMERFRKQKILDEYLQH
jgi:ribosomal protein S3AE